MNEESAESPKTPEGVDQQPSNEVNQSTEVDAKTESMPTPDKSVNRGGGWKTWLRRIGIGGAAAGVIATGGAAVSEASAATPEKPATSISQMQEPVGGTKGESAPTAESNQSQQDTKVIHTSSGDTIKVTEKDGHVVEDTSLYNSFTISKVDKDTVVVEGEGASGLVAPDGGHYDVNAKDAVQSGLTDLAKVGMDIKDVQQVSNPDNKDQQAVKVDVDDTNKLDRITHSNDQVLKEDGHVEEVTSPYDSFTISKVDKDTVIVEGENASLVGQDGGHYDVNAKDAVKSGLADLAKAGMDIKKDTPVDAFHNDQNHSVVKVDVDNANNLDKVAKNLAEQNQ